MFTITIGLLGLTVLYVGMIIALHYLLPISIDCLSNSNFNSGVVEVGDDGINDVTNTQELECQTEGVDNTILNWSSDFFISICFFIFAFQLSCCPSSSSSSIKKGRKKAKAVKDTRVCYKSAILSQIFMGGSFLVTGISSIMYPNSGLDDNHGLMGYFILEIISNIFFTFSALCMAQFAFDTTKNIDPTLLKNTCCFCWCNSTSSKIWIAVCGLLLVLSLSGILTGNIWCSTDPTLQVNDVNDVWLPTTDGIAVCYTVTKYSDIAIHFSYALLWLPVGYSLRVASLAKPVTVLGLPTPISVVLAVIIQWTIGSMLIVVVFIITSILNKINNNNDDDDEDFYTIYFTIWNTIYGTVLYHWGMLITMYCLHNLSYGLTVPDRDDEDDIDEGPSVLSTEWWLTILAFVLPAETRKKKKKRNDDMNDDNAVEEEEDKADASATQNKRVVSFEEVDYIVEEEIDV